jgi:hypothetical protein
MSSDGLLRAIHSWPLAENKNIQHDPHCLARVKNICTIFPLENERYYHTVRRKTEQRYFDATGTSPQGYLFQLKCEAQHEINIKFRATCKEINFRTYVMHQLTQLGLNTRMTALNCEPRLRLDAQRWQYRVPSRLDEPRVLLSFCRTSTALSAACMKLWTAQHQDAGSTGCASQGTIGGA